MYRVSTNQVFFTGQSYLMDNTARLNRLNEQISAGKRILDPSDDPVAKEMVLKQQKILQEAETYKKNAQDAQYQLESAEEAMTGVMNTLSALKDLTLQMANDTVNADDRRLAREQVLKAMSDIVSQGNTQIDGFYIFGGYRTGQPAFTSPDGTYQGDENVRTLEVAPSVYKQVAFTGSEVFTGVVGGVQTGVNIFTMITGLAEDLLNNDGNAIRNRIGELDDALEQVTRHRSSAGNLLQEVEIAENLNVSDILQGKIKKSALEDIDVTSAMTEFSSLKLTLEATMAATSKVMELSLLKYLQ